MSAQHTPGTVRLSPWFPSARYPTRCIAQRYEYLIGTRPYWRTLKTFDSEQSARSVFPTAIAKATGSAS